MVINSTPFISYHNIKIKKDVDLIEDAWGLNYEFCDMINLLSQLRTAPGRNVTNRLIKKIREQN